MSKLHAFQFYKTETNIYINKKVFYFRCLSFQKFLDM
jgi:hypothetical protein